MIRKRILPVFMTAMLMVTLLCAMVITGCSSSSDDGGGSSTSATLSGTVTDSATESAVEKATVKLGDGETTTGSDGTYSFSGLSTGTFTMTVSKSGYQEYEASVTIIEGSNTKNVTLTAETTQTGSLTGTVKYGDALLEGVLVALQNVGNYTTLEDGAYSFTQVSYGTYTISATKTGYETYSSSVAINASANTHDISMSVGQDIPAPDEGKGHIVGIVTDSSDNPLVGVQCTLYSLSGKNNVRLNTVESDENGQYAFLNVAPGTYQVTFVLGGYNIPSITTTVSSGSVTEPPANPGDVVSPDVPNPPVQDKAWQFNYGGSGEERANSIALTSDGGSIVAGYTLSSASGDVKGVLKGANDFWVVKLDSSNKIEWEKNYGGNNVDKATSIQQTSDDGYIIAGTTTSSANGDVTGASNGSFDWWIVKLDSSGTIEWQKNYGGSDYDVAHSVRQTSDGGYIVAGETSSSASGDVSGVNKGNRDFWIIKLNGSGAIEWEKNYGGNFYEIAYSIQQTSDGGYIVGGATSSSANGDITGVNNGSFDCWIVKLNSTGVIEWEKNYGGDDGEDCWSIRQTTDGGYVAAGYTGSSATGDVTGVSNGGNDYWLVKLNSTGVLEWEKNYGGSDLDQCKSVRQTTDGGYIVTGLSNSTASGDFTGTTNGLFDFWTIKVNGTGVIEWEKNYGGSADDQGFGIIQVADDKYIMCGYTASSVSGDVTGINNGSSDFWIVKVKSDGEPDQ